MFELKNENGAAFYISSMLKDTGLVKHGFSTRRGGVSKGCYSSMNLRFHCDDSEENILKNYSIIAKALGIDYKKLVLPKQMHEDNIYTVHKNDCGNGIVRPNAFKSADGFVIPECGVPAAVSYADCVPVLFLDKRQRIAAAVHSGWRGTVKRIAQKAVIKMKNEFGSKAEDILVAIGPSIQECHFEVGDEVAEIFLGEFGNETAVRYGKNYHVNMQRAIVLQLTEEGIPSKNIDNCGICTYCNSDLLFSHRKTNGKRGNMCAFIELK